MTSLSLPREGWAPCLESLLLWLILPQALAGLLLQAEQADPFSSLISMLSVVSCGEVQSHPPRPGRGVTGWHHLFPEVCAPGPCGHVSSGLDEVELCWQWMPLSLTSVISYSPVRFPVWMCRWTTGGWGRTLWVSLSVTYGQIRLPLSGRSISVLHLSMLVLKYLGCKTKSHWYKWPVEVVVVDQKYTDFSWMWWDQRVV